MLRAFPRSKNPGVVPARAARAKRSRVLNLPAAVALCLLLYVALPGTAVGAASPDDQGWLPITPQDLALKDCPQQPGAPAMILYRQEDTDQNMQSTDVYFRIKVFTEAGKERGDIEIPYVPKLVAVENIRGRTIHPDSKILDFDGEVYERQVIRQGRFKVQEKAFALPGVEPGSIIEYAYRLRGMSDLSNLLVHPNNYVLSQAVALGAVEWGVQSDLFTSRAVFTIHPFRGRSLSWARIGPPIASAPERERDGSFKLEAVDIPPVAKEEDMPSVSALTTRFDFYYVMGSVKDDRDYWLGVAKLRGQMLEYYIRENRGVRHEADQIVSPGDSDEAKARKIYARMKEVRNLSAEPLKTVKEQRKEGLKINTTVSDVLKHDYARGNEIDYAYVALARAAGLDADMIELRDRLRGGLALNDLNAGQTDAEVLRVKIGNKDVFLDPAAKFCPYGVLPWEETEVAGIVASSQHPEIVTVPAITSDQAVIRREANLELNESGDLSGELKLTYTGEEAYLERLLESNKDSTDRRKDAEDAVKRWVESGGSVKLTNEPAWNQTADTLDLVFSLRVPAFALREGRHLFVSPAVFETGRPYPFQALRREDPIDLRFPHEQVDTITVAVPAGFQVEAVPEERQVTRPYGRYDATCRKDGNRIVFTRHTVITQSSFPVEKYSDLHLFFDAMRAGDREQVLFEEVQSATR